MIELPDDLRAFLKKRAKLKYDSAETEPGKITLLPDGKHILGEVYINNGHDGDPHAQDDGSYVVPAVNLVKSCEGYPPEYILLWLPNTNQYGTWDCDHYELSVFENTAWSDIVGDPVRYINAQWYPNETGTEVERPWELYSFRKGQR